MKSQWQTLLWLAKPLFALLLGIPFLATSCGGGGSAPMPVQLKSVSVSIMPLTATIGEGRTLSFVATVTGAADTTVSWTVQEGGTGGSVTASGGYTAPGSPGTYHVIATSIADPTATASAVVKVEAPSGAFTLVGDMTAARAQHTATLLGSGKVLIAGGSGQGGLPGPPLGGAELYDPSTRTFTPAGSMITPRYYHSATLLADGRVLLAGGTQNVNVGASVFTAEIYDPSAGVFAPTGNLNAGAGSVFAFTGPVTALLPDGRVFVAGANNPEVFDPQSGTFTLTGPYADPGPILVSTVTLLTNGNVLITGCSKACSAGVTEIFNPQSGTLSATGVMPGGSWYDESTATSLGDGRILFLSSDEDADPAGAEVYDATAGTFAAIGYANDPHEFAPATRLTDGTVLLTGGQLIGGNGSTAAELFLPPSAMFQLAGSMNVGRHSHTATLLSDGTVLVTGGFSGWPDPTNSSEIYTPTSK